MIHDARVAVTCDNERCTEEVDVELNYGYSSYSGRSGSYDDSDSAIEQKLVDDFDWLVRDGKHFCDESCVPGATEED